MIDVCLLYRRSSIIFHTPTLNTCLNGFWILMFECADQLEHIQSKYGLGAETGPWISLIRPAASSKKNKTILINE